MMARLIGCGGCALLVSACGQGDQTDLQQWMQTINQQIVPVAQPWVEPEAFSAEAYVALAGLEPFDPLRLPRPVDPAGVGKPPAPDQPPVLPRPTSLETSPLSALTFVGSLTRGTKRIAVVKMVDTFHQVQLGSRLGLGGGRVIEISETEIKLRGQVQNDRGAWVERVTSLSLQKK